MNCSDGKILRKAYTAKRGSKRTSVKASCVADRGMPGHGPKTLPALDNKLHLKEYGYSTKKSQRARRTSLKKASRANGTLPVLRRLNLIGNYSKSAADYPVIRSDVEYLKSEYAAEKRASRRASKQKGGCPGSCGQVGGDGCGRQHGAGCGCGQKGGRKKKRASKKH